MVVTLVYHTSGPLRLHPFATPVNGSSLGIIIYFHVLKGKAESDDRGVRERGGSQVASAVAFWDAGFS